MVKIAPSILSADFLNLENEIDLVQRAGADILHLDVMDGHFVPNLTFGMPIIKQIKEIAKIPLDVHLMVSNPAIYLDLLTKWKINYVSFHQEAEIHLHRQIHVLKNMGVKAGIALNPATPVESILPVLPDLDFVLLMSVNPGFGGQSFLPLVYSKIKTLRMLAEKTNPKLEIEVDGGINNENSHKLQKCGANMLVAGSYVFKSNDYSQQISSLR